MSAIESPVIDYASRLPRRLTFHLLVFQPSALLIFAFVLLAVDAFVFAIPALRLPISFGQPLAFLGDVALFVAAYFPWILAVFIGWTFIANRVNKQSTFALRLARSIALGMFIFNVFLAPGVSAYGRLVWGAC